MLDFVEFSVKVKNQQSCTLVEYQDSFRCTDMLTEGGLHMLHCYKLRNRNLDVVLPAV